MRYIYAFLLFLCSLNVFSQHSNFNSTVFNKPLPPSIYQLVKHQDLPISEYTGTVDVKIPLFNISLKNHQIPINISYNTNGIKVSQSFSPVGLGWSLTDFGSIVQHVLGKDDLVMLPPVYAPKQIYMNVPDYIYDSGSTPWMPIYDNTTPDASMITTNPSKFKPSRWIVFGTKSLYKNGERVMFDGLLNQSNDEDSERDIFSVKLPTGKNISFVLFDNESVIKSLHGDGSRVYMTKNVQDSYVDIDFKVVDTDGTQYFFEQQHDVKVSTVTLDYGVGSPYWQYKGGGSGISESTYDTKSDFYKSYKSWFITKIIYPDGNVVFFNYSTSKRVLKEYSQQYLGSLCKRVGSYSLMAHNPNTRVRGVEVSGLPSEYKTIFSGTRFMKWINFFGQF